MGKYDNVTWKKMEVNTWDYENQKEVMGILVSVETDKGDYHSNLYTLDTEDGFVGVWGSTIIDTRLKNAKIGELIKITYLGTEKSTQRKGATYKNFEVYHAETKDLEKELIPDKEDFTLDLDNLDDKI